MSEETKEFLKSPRGKALIKLGFYIIFFIFVFIFLGTHNAKPVEHVKTALEKYTSMTNYEYEYRYNDIVYNGITYRNKMYFTIDNVDYYYDKEVFKREQETLELIPVELDKWYYLNNVTISDYIKKGNIIAKTEDYETSTLQTKYSVSDILWLEVYEKDNSIYKVVVMIDDNNKVEITYSNVGQVLDPTR